MHKKMWALHNWIGLYAGVVIAILSITGVAALFKVEIDEALNAKLFKVEPSQKSVPMTPIIDSLKTVYGAENLYSVRVPKAPGDTWAPFFFIQKSRLKVQQLEVFINPHTGEILGERDVYKSFAYFLRNIHVRLYEALFGRQIVGLAGIALLISTITGFWIYGGFMKRQFFGTIRRKNLRMTMADYHKVIGVATLFFNLMIAITGAWLGLQVYLQPLIAGERPGIFNVEEKPLTEEEDRAYRIDFDSVYAKGRQLFPELIPAYIQLSRDGSRTVTLMGDVARTAFERDSYSITFDKQNLKELHRYDIREASFGDKVFYVQESLHFGDWGGILLKIVYAFLGITSGFLALTGFIVYLKRTERGRKEKPKFIELKPLLLRWTFAILGVMVLLAFLSMIFGIAVPSILIIVSLYASILFLLIKALVLFIRKRFFNRPKRLGTS